MSRASARPERMRPSWLTRQLQDHTRTLGATLARLRSRPFGTLLTALVIGLTLSLPAGLQALIGDLGTTGHALGAQSLQVTLFLKDTVDTAAGRALTDKLARRHGVASARYTSQQAALDEFRTSSGAAQALDLLDSNPLPASITVLLDPHQPQEAARKLEHALAALPQVEHAQMNVEWLKRLYALIAVLQRGVMLFAIGLSVTVLIVVANTIRLDIENRRREIAVMKLLGATNAFVRRPFLYMGLCYGLAGALLAWLLVTAGVLALDMPIRRLAGLYGSDFSLGGLDFQQTLALLGFGLLLGWIGAFVTVSRHLHRIEPD